MKSIPGRIVREALLRDAASAIADAEQLTADLIELQGFTNRIDTRGLTQVVAIRPARVTKLPMVNLPFDRPT